MRAHDIEFPAIVRLDTPREREYLRHGGILPWTGPRPVRMGIRLLDGDGRPLGEMRGVTIPAGVAPGEELVLEPFSRLIEADQLLAYKHEGFWRCMDNLKDRQTLEEMVEQGRMPWRGHDGTRRARALSIAGL